MFGAISADLLFDLARMDGYMYQLSLPLTPPEYTLPEEYFEDVNLGYSKLEQYTGSSFGSTYSEDHPGFAKLRDELERDGYIETSRNSRNGDMVCKRFRLNGKWFDKGDRFPCGVAQRWDLNLGRGIDLRIIEKGRYNEDKRYELIVPDYMMEQIGWLFNEHLSKEKIVDPKTEHVSWKITKIVKAKENE